MILYQRDVAFISGANYLLHGNCHDCSRSFIHFWLHIFPWFFSILCLIMFHSKHKSTNEKRKPQWNLFLNLTIVIQEYSGTISHYLHEKYIIMKFFLSAPTPVSLNQSIVIICDLKKNEINTNMTKLSNFYWKKIFENVVWFYSPKLLRIIGVQPVTSVRKLSSKTTMSFLSQSVIIT